MTPLIRLGCLALVLACTGMPPNLRAATVLSVDALVDWKHPLGMTAQEFEDKLPKALPATARTNPRGDGELLAVVRSSDPDEYRILGGKFKVQTFSARITNERLQYLTITVRATPTEVIHALQEIYSQPPSTTQLRNASTGATSEGFAWRFEQYSTLIIPREMGQILISISGTSAPSAPATATSTPTSDKIMADLDYLLNSAELWKCDIKTFEKLYVAKKEEKQDDPPQFEWLTAAKDRARFSRKMYSNIETKLTMFGGSIKVEEATVEFVNGHAARATVSFYNRGDSGEISAKEFDAVFKKIGQNLGQAFKVNPKRELMPSNAAIRTIGWNWTTPVGVALLEYNEYGGASKPEFLRLKLAAPNQADWSMGRLAVGVQRMALTKNITRSQAGDVYIAGVPMVDQGAKGYCVAASCQRLFEYMQIPCDQHEMAQLLNVDVERGADAIEMQKSLAKVDGQFKVTFKPLVNPELYYDNKGKRRVSQKEFAGIVKEHVDKGIPLLWALQLGLFKEDPPLPGDGQVSGGHMRVIIGYNSSTNKILFTDSWGAGHELKRMDASDAYQATLGVYSMSPRGL